jgi:hypothetical protein
MNEERDDVLGEIRASLAIDPSPAFAARVRAAAGRQLAVRSWWPWSLTAAVAAVSVVAVVVQWPTMSQPQEQVPRAVREAAPEVARPAWPPMSAPGASTAARPVAPVRPDGAASMADARAERQVRVGSAHVEPPSGATIATRTPGSGVLIPADQADGVRRLIAAVRAERAVARQVRVWTGDDLPALPLLPEIEIAPIVVARLDADRANPDPMTEPAEPPAAEGGTR